MRYAYPCVMEAEDDGGFSVSFPDIPEALTCGDDRAGALTMAADALAMALAGYVQDRRDIPVPGTAGKDMELVSVPPVVAAKLALYCTMRDQKITKVSLAKRLGVSESAVRKLLDPDHRSHIGLVEKSLKMLGRMLIIEDHAA